MGDVARLRNGERRRAAHEKPQRELALGDTACACEVRQCLAAREVAAAERTVRDDGNAVLLAPRNDAVLDRPVLQMIEDLVTCDRAVSDETARLLEIVRVEVR